ncbi:hypothetical protein D046_4401B, partial [Vibrio parahaemolyticus V-223/04]
SEKLNDLPW